MKKKVFSALFLSFALMTSSVIFSSCSGEEKKEEKPVETVVESVTEEVETAAPAEVSGSEEIAPVAGTPETGTKETKTPVAGTPEAATKETKAPTPKTTTTATPTPVKSVKKGTVAPEMTFETKEFDFGDINQGDKTDFTFKFTNTGNAPLIISNAQASCGCTIPQWPAEPIPPGDTGEIEVEFNSKGKSGRQTKAIRISTNISDQPEVVYLKGNVNLPEQGK